MGGAAPCGPARGEGGIGGGEEKGEGGGGEECSSICMGLSVDPHVASVSVSMSVSVSVSV